MAIWTLIRYKMVTESGRSSMGGQVGTKNEDAVTK